jgi:hypothetical protein
MRKIDLIKQKYLGIGVREDNIDFAIDAVLEGTKRELIIETLSADYRGMPEAQSSQLLEELFEANGGEFKKENRGGYLYGYLLLLVGVLGAGILVAILLSGEWRLKFIILSGAAALFGLVQGPVLLYKAFRGKYRDGDAPFENS